MSETSISDKRFNEEGWICRNYKDGSCQVINHKHLKKKVNIGDGNFIYGSICEERKDDEMVCGFTPIS